MCVAQNPEVKVWRREGIKEELDVILSNRINVFSNPSVSNLDTEMTGLEKVVEFTGVQGPSFAGCLMAKRRLVIGRLEL